MTVAEDLGEKRPGAARTWANTTFDAFRDAPVRILILGSFFYSLGYFMGSTAQAAVAFDLTGDNGAVGIVLFGQGIAMLMVVPFGGAIADRFSKRMLIQVAQISMIGVMVAIAVLLMLDQLTIPLLASGALIVGITFGIYGPARMAMIGETVPSDRAGNAVALVLVANNSGRIVGPMAAGMLLAISGFGSTGTYFVLAGIFFMVLVTMSKLNDGGPRQDKKKANVLDDVREGVRYVFTSPPLRHAVLTFHMVTMIGLSYYVVMPGFAKEVLDSGNAGLGLILGTAAAGGFCTSFLVASFVDTKYAQHLLIACIVMGGIALISTSFAPSLPVAALTMMFAAGGVTGFQTLSNALTLRYAEPIFHGRIFGLIFMAGGLYGIASLPFGFLADHIGERATLAGTGSTLLVVALISVLTRPSLDEFKPSSG